MATDGVLSYAMFTYKCGGLNWLDYSASIGFSITQNFFANHELSLTPNVNDIACASNSVSGWSNVVYQVSGQHICEVANICKNGGECIFDASISDNYTCNCTGNYTGDTCEGMCMCFNNDDIICKLECNYVCGEGEAPHSSCDGSCIIVDICVATSPCQNGGTCVTIRGTSYHCVCPSFYFGANCEGIGFHMCKDHKNKMLFLF